MSLWHSAVFAFGPPKPRLICGGGISCCTWRILEVGKTLPPTTGGSRRRTRHIALNHGGHPHHAVVSRTGHVTAPIHADAAALAIFERDAMDAIIQHGQRPDPDCRTLAALALVHMLRLGADVDPTPDAIERAVRVIHARAAMVQGSTSAYLPARIASIETHRSAERVLAFVTDIWTPLSITGQTPPNH